MKIVRTLFLLTLAALTLCSTSAQELNISVKINAPALKIADPRTIVALEKAISEFYNVRKLTGDDFELEERIEGNIQINIKDDPQANSFVADMFITTGRPVYNSNYTSPVLNHVDRDISFTYSELDPLRDNRNVFTDNFSSILTFYAYIIIGFDYDSFSPAGGDQYFKIANNIVANIPPNVSSSDRNWSSLGSDRNRYWLMENLLNTRMRRYRQAYYDYHRKGLDKMSEDPIVSKAVILSALKEMNNVNETNPNSMILQMFSNSKRSEILEIFKNSIKSEQRQVFDIMAKFDPAQSDFLRELR